MRFDRSAGQPYAERFGTPTRGSIVGLTAGNSLAEDSLEDGNWFGDGNGLDDGNWFGDVTGLDDGNWFGDVDGLDEGNWYGDGNGLNDGNCSVELLKKTTNNWKCCSTSETLVVLMKRIVGLILSDW